MPTTSASSASSGQRSADLLEHRRENSQATNRIRDGRFAPTGSISRSSKRGAAAWCCACMAFPIMHRVGPTFSIVLRRRDIGPSRQRCEDFGRVAPHPTDPIAPWRPGRTYWRSLPGDAGVSPPQARDRGILGRTGPRRLRTATSCTKRPTRHRSAILRFLPPPAGQISTHRHQ